MAFPSLADAGVARTLAGMNSQHTPSDRVGRSSARPRLVIVPGLRGSGAGHWQSWLHGQIADAVRVEQDDWDTPDLARWSDRIADTLASLGPGPQVIVAHSFGCLASVHLAARRPADIAQMLLVAPAEPDRFGVAQLLPQARLAVPSCMVASDDDPWMSAARAHAWALRWGSQWISLGKAGHINVDSGYGPFPLAREWAAGALNRLELRPWRVAA